MTTVMHDAQETLRAYDKTFRVIRCSLWPGENCEADQRVYEVLNQHAILALPAGILARMAMPEELRAAWKNAVLRQTASYYQYLHAQATLPVTVPYVILKGTAAAQYYPHPEYRTMGDIDLMTRREDFQTACEELLAAGYVENTVIPLNGVIRHRGFEKDHLEVEVHAYFAMLSDAAQAEYLDGLILSGIGDSHLLPELVNGLTLLEHISQHLEEGLGLRQIIDWMMFVDRCLPDGRWEAFQDMVSRCGLERLALTVTRMCEVYLGLPPRVWCQSADEEVCASLMSYVLACGNFGSRLERDSYTSERVISLSRSPRAVFALLQRYGEINWRASQSHPILRPFAWLYQLGRYVKKGWRRKGALGKLRSEYSAAKKREALLEALGVPQSAKGVTVYEDGRYTKDR